MPKPFYHKISKQFIKDNRIVEFGSIARRSENLEGSSLTFKTIGTHSPGIAYQKSQPISIWEETEDSFIYTAYLTGIAPQNYGKDYTIRTYAKDAEGNIYYGIEIELSIFDVAWSIDHGYSESGDAPTENDILAFEVFAKSDDEYAEYRNWLAVEGKSAGSLSDFIE